MEDLVYYAFNLDRGSYFPDMHWDRDYHMVCHPTPPPTVRPYQC